VLGWNTAVNVFAPVIETVQLVPEDVVHPVQYLKIEPGPGAAVKLTEAPFAMVSVQLTPGPVSQTVAPPAPVMVPLPPPDEASVSG
jgi:hypothetical protein